MSDKENAGKRSMQWGIRLVGLLMLGSLVAVAHGAGTATIEILPSAPTPVDNISVRLFGEWPDSCVPREPQVSISDNEIRVDTFNPGEVCLQVISSWELLVPIGYLSANTYDLTVTYSSPSIGTEPAEIGQTVVTVENAVGGAVNGGNPSRVICKNITTGQTVMIQDHAASWNCEAAGLLVNPGDRIRQTIIGTAD